MLSRNSCVKRLNANTSIRTGKRSDSSQLLHRAEKGGRNNILQKPLDKTASAGVLRCAFLVSYAALITGSGRCSSVQALGLEAKQLCTKISYQPEASTTGCWKRSVTELTINLEWPLQANPTPKSIPFDRALLSEKDPSTIPLPSKRGAILYFIFNYSEPYQWGLFSV